MKIFIFILSLIINTISLKGAISYIKGPVPSDAILIYKSREYKCGEGYHAYEEQRAAKALKSDTPVPWIDISKYITDAHKALGFIDIILTVVADEATDYNDPEWRLYGDSDDRWLHDLRASCDGKLYDMIDPEAKKPWEGKLFSHADCGDYCILRFAVPSEIFGKYKIFLGKENIRAEMWDGDSHYANWYQVKLYMRPLAAGPYAHVAVENVGKIYSYEYDINAKAFTIPEPHIQVVVNTPVEFSAEKSVDTSGAEIVEYRWDFNGDGTYDKITSTPFARYVYTHTGTNQVILEVENFNGKTSKNVGSPFVSKSSDPLPLFVEVIESIPHVELFQNSPNPFILNEMNVTSIKFKIDTTQRVMINIYDYNGNLVKMLEDKIYTAGVWEIHWNGKDESGSEVSQGIYFYTLITKNHVISKTMLIVK